MFIHRPMLFASVIILALSALAFTLFSFPFVFFTGIFAVVSIMTRLHALTNNVVLLCGDKGTCSAVLCWITAIIQVVAAAVVDERFLSGCSDQDQLVMCKVVFYQVMNAIGASLWIILGALMLVVKVDVTSTTTPAKEHTSTSTQPAVVMVTSTDSDSETSTTAATYDGSMTHDGTKARECIV